MKKVFLFLVFSLFFGTVIYGQEQKQKMVTCIVFFVNEASFKYSAELDMSTYGRYTLMDGDKRLRTKSRALIMDKLKQNGWRYAGSFVIGGLHLIFEKMIDRDEEATKGLELKPLD